jgi:hypothetical protein
MVLLGIDDGRAYGRGGEVLLTEVLLLLFCGTQD